MPEMQKAISELRFLLASIKGKPEELDGLSRQFKRQLRRAPNYPIQGGNSLEAALTIMEEIQERLDSVETTRRHLSSIRDRARSELQALELTNKIEQAKTELASLRGGNGPGERVPNAEAEKIEELERFVQEASIQAAQNITGNEQASGRRAEA